MLAFCGLWSSVILWSLWSLLELLQSQGQQSSDEGKYEYNAGYYDNRNF